MTSLMWHESCLVCSRQKEISSDKVYAVNLDYLMGKLEGERKRAVYFKPNGPFHSTMVHDQKFIDHPLSLKTAHF